MPIIGGKYYANPSYGRALEEAREAGAQESSAPGGHGQLRHVEVHPRAGGGFHVLSHYHHPEHGPHAVHSEHDDHASAAHAVQRVLRAHDAR